MKNDPFHPAQFARLLGGLRRNVLLVAIVALIVPSGALASLWGTHYLVYGQCCGGTQLDGTRAYISVSTVAPAASDCLLFSSVVGALNTQGQLQPGLVRCGPNANLDGMCSLNNNFVKFVERIPHAGGSPVCYAHGAASVGGSYLVTVDETWDNGTWWTFIAGEAYEGQSGYDNSVAIFEWGEHTGNTCAGFNAAASFATWQRYNFGANMWTTVQSALTDTGGCWSVSGVSNGNFNISR